MVVEEEPELAEDMVEQVLSMQEPDGLELVTVEQALVTQASNLLEESDINNVLSTIQPDEFNDLFTGKNFSVTFDFQRKLVTGHVKIQDNTLFWI